MLFSLKAQHRDNKPKLSSKKKAMFLLSSNLCNPDDTTAVLAKGVHI
jgi:hypothetical protein